MYTKTKKRKNLTDPSTIVIPYLRPGFGRRITRRLRYEGDRLLLRARPDAFNGDALNAFAEKEWNTVISFLKDEKAIHLAAITVLADKRKSRVKLLNTSIEELEKRLQKINEELDKLDNEGGND